MWSLQQVTCRSPIQGSASIELLIWNGRSVVPLHDCLPSSFAGGRTCRPAKPEQAGDQRARAVRLDGPSRQVVANPPLSEARRIPADCRMTRVINSLPGISAGVAAFPEHGTTSAELLTVADQCLYESKSRGRDVVTVSPYGGPLNPSQVTSSAT
jgi:hypothetical protein